MNPKYYTTPEEVQRVTDFLNRNGIGGGVAELVLPDFRGPFRIPTVAGKEQHGLKLKNGTEVNAGLVLDLMDKYPEHFAASTIRAGV